MKKRFEGAIRWKGASFAAYDSDDKVDRECVKFCFTIYAMDLFPDVNVDNERRGFTKKTKTLFRVVKARLDFIRFKSYIK